MVDVFVSYAHEDRTRIEPLVARFEAEGWSVWWDRDITPGEQFSQTIDTAIQSASCIVVAWSRASLKSSWVHNEALEGLDRGVLVPVALDVIRTPVAFRQSQAALLTKWPAEYDPQELEALLHGIRRMLDAADRSDVAVAPVDSGPGGRNETLAILRQFEAEGEVEKAVAVAQRLAQAYPLDDEVQALWLNHSALYELVSEPEGAQVFCKPYAQPEDNWRLLGATPLEVRLPHGTLRFKVELDGYDAAEFCDTVPGFEDKSALGEIFGVALPRQVQLQPVDAMHGDRVFVPGGDLAHLVAGGAVGRRNVIADYFIDRYPVTNADYQAFVDMGGYSDESLWADLTFDEAGEVHTLHEALARFVDATGRPGPVGWQFAQFPEGEQDFPVTGISWFEASAYAKFAGGALPTAAHWNRAAREYQEVLSTFSGAVVAQSNFSEHLQPVTESTAVGAFGIRDMAGNAREWVRNAMVDGYATLGGSHLDPGYMFIFNAPVAPWQRDGLTGFRTIVSLGKDDPYLERPIHSFGEPRDFSPVGDDVFQILETQFGYTPATPKVTIREVASPSRRRRYERVALNFTDGTSLELYVIVPASANHPLQPLICFPGQTDFQSHRETNLELYEMLALLVDSGRALVCPIFHGSNERYAGVMQMTPEEQKIYYRDAEPTWHRELGRTLDYVATRDDLDVESAVYVGMSYGVAFPLPAAIMETRFKAYLLLHGGLVPWSRDLWAPITDMKNYLPRLTRPTFLLSGSYDTIFPVKSQQALYDHIGTVPEDKCWIRTETGHGFISDRELLRIVDWLDERFGS